MSCPYTRLRDPALVGLSLKMKLARLQALRARRHASFRQTSIGLVMSRATRLLKRNPHVHLAVTSHQILR